MKLKPIIPYLIAIFLFIISSLTYFYPVLEGKKLFQSDIAQFQGMSQEIKDFRAEHGEEPYWTGSDFSGMPAYQVSAYYQNDYIKKLDQLIRFLPRPADYLFLYFLSFFVLMLVLKVDWRIAVLGALGFGLSTYLIIILGVGHNAKAHAIGYMPLVLAGVLLVFRQKYLWGFTLTTLAAALEIVAGHVQMTYYLFFMMLILGIVYFIKSLKEKQFFSYIKSVLLLIVAGVLALLMNANHLLPTREYAKESTRSKSELTINPDGSPKEPTGGLSKEYITEYSYGIAETFNLFIPRFMGGGNHENIGTKSDTYSFLRDKIGVAQARDFTEHAPMYWGGQPIVAAPAYIGAVLIFLFVLSLYVYRGKYKTWLLISIVFALFLSWGKNFGFLTDFFINYVPLYDKFRAVSSMQVLIELAIPVLAILGLHRFLFSDELSVNTKQKYLLNTLFITGGIALFFVLLGSSWFSFESPNDAFYEQMIPGFSEVLIADRKSLLFQDSIRSLLLVLGSALILWLFLKKKLKLNIALLVLALVLIFDLGGVAKRYVNSSDFVAASRVDKPFVASEVDKSILQDTTYYRVANFAANPMSDGATSYFHHSIGGYHAAKLRRYQELFDYQIAQNNMEVLNMLNTKYFILSDEGGQKQVQVNDSVFGPAWFVSDIKWVNTADEEIKALDSIDKKIVVLEEKYRDIIPTHKWLYDDQAQIHLTHYQANELRYEANSLTGQLAVFSEIYYPHGWKAYVDGVEFEILRANYVLRALWLPPGKNEVVFKFEPEVVKKGAWYSLLGYIGFVVVFALFFIMRIKTKQN